MKSDRSMAVAKKNKKKGLTSVDDPELKQDDDSAAPSLDGDGEAAGQKMGKKKGKSKKGGWLQMDEDMEAILAEMEGTNLGGTTTSGDIPDELEGIEGENIVTSSGKEKGKENGNVSATITDENNGDYFTQPDARVDDGDEVIIQFSGKKKGRKGKKSDKPSDDLNDFKLEERSESKVVAAVETEAVAADQTDKLYSAHIEDDEKLDDVDVETIQFSGKKKGRKGKKSDKPSDDAQSQEAYTEKMSQSETLSTTGAEIEGEEPVQFTGKKKGKKGKKAEKMAEDAHFYAILAELDASKDDGEFRVGSEGTHESRADDSAQSETIIDVEIQRNQTAMEDETIRFAGKKKGKKGKKMEKSPENEANLAELDQPKDPDESITEQLVQSIAHEGAGSAVHESLATTSQKKSKKGKKGGRIAQDEEDLDALLAELDGSKPVKTADVVQSEPLESVAQQVQMDVVEPVNDAVMEDETIRFAGKKKGKKGKEMEKSTENEANLAELDGPKDPEESRTEHLVQSIAYEAAGSAVHESLATTSQKKSKRGKKGGRTAQDEEDLDALLAELDGPKPVKTADVVVPSEPLEAVAQQVQVDAVEPVNDAGTDDVLESAAAKKKKKKKEKEKEKSKAASSGRQVDQVAKEDVIEEKPETLKGKALDKKVPKHIREMQERLSKMKEAEERRKQEEEEKRRKEEEEQRRLEELERLKEEAKRRRKEREKEKLLKKKQEGKLLTGKQKEEARRLAMMREQMLAQRGMTVDSDYISKEETTTGPKKPKYESKKKRRPHGADVVTTEEQNGVDVVSMEEHTMEEQEAESLDVQEDAFMEVESTPEQEPEVEVYEEEVAVEDEIEEDWDEKSWEEEVALPAVKSAFAEEEEGPTVLKKATKRVVSQPPSDHLPSKIITSQQNPASLVTKPAQHAVQEHGDETESDDESDSDEDDAETRRRREAASKREARKAEALSKRTADDLRSPICCILGHVDTGKTKLLDCIRRTNVQEGEAGGITQQIGATYFPMENIRERTKELKTEANLRVPGLLVIDTPGHESFTNLRARGSGLCDIAILVIDIMHGLEPQTIESLNLLKMRHTPFVVALNKVDRLYNWKSRPNAPIRLSFKQQERDVLSEFERRLVQITTQLKEQGMNSELYFKNKEIRKYVSIVPTSAISGEGVPDLLMLLVQLTQKLMEEKLMFISEVQCTVLEVKVIEGLGTTIDVILVNGVLHEGDQIVVCGMQGPIVTTIRALLTPHPMKELRVKGSYQHHKELKAAQGIKITAQGLDHAIAGTQLYVVGPEDDLEDLNEEAMQDMKNVMSRVDKSGEGVCVQASTLGSLEALLEFLKSPAVKIPVSGINIGPVHKRDVIRASVMLERKKKEYATILAFDVKVTPEAKELAEELGVKIFMADIIYHLFDQFTAYMNNVKEEKRKEVADEAVFPCVLKILPAHIYNKKDPIVVGVDVLEGVARVGTPICVPSRDFIDIGKIFSIEVNHKVVDTAKKGQSVALKIVGTTPEETQKMLGRHFEPEDELVSHITRRSIDVLKENYRDDLSMDEWRLVLKLKKLFNIP